MFAIIGIVLVFGAVIGGFLMEKGKMPVLVQPAELLIIGGSAIGTLLVANPLPLIIKIFKSLVGVLGAVVSPLSSISRASRCSAISFSSPGRAVWRSWR